MNTYKLLPSLALAVMLGACADMSSGLVVGGNQNTANAIRPAADPFQQALIQGYKQQADEDYREGNYRSADRYYRKAIALAAGKSVVMEDPAFWTSATGDRSKGLYGTDLRTVTTTRARLAPWIEATKGGSPHEAANQQVKFDCWIEEMAEQQYARAADCQPAMQVAAAPAPASVIEPPAVVLSAAPTPKAAVVNSCSQNPDGYNQYGTLCKVSIINFGFNRYDLLQPGQNDVGNQSTSEQAASLDQIIRQVGSIKPARIDIMGRADSSGEDSYNYGLSDCRARSVVAALRKRGLPASVETRIIPLGSTDLIVPTGSNVREARNRVVMVAYQSNRNAPSAARPATVPTLDTFGCGSARHPSPLSFTSVADNN